MTVKREFGGIVPIYEKGGFGFINEDIRRSSDDEMLRIPELSSAFIPFFWLTEKSFSELKADGRGVYLESEKISDALGYAGRQIPLLYRETVDGIGNYRVTVKIDNVDGDDDDIAIYITRRRLYYKGKLSRGEVFERSFDINVCDFIPRGYKTEFAGNSVDIAILGKRPRLTSVFIEKLDNVPTVWVAGDSTLTDQSADYPYHPSTSYSGWGQMLSAFLKNGIAVSNHAHSGLTTHTFMSGGHNAIVERNIKAGDFFILQFAHNDQKCDFLTADGGYRERVINYCNYVREKGAYPMIVTPISRNSWLGGGVEYNDLLFAYDKECKKIGEELKVPVIGLHDFMMEIVKTEGLQMAKRHYFPGDYTHTNDPGAFMCAEFIAKELSKLDGEYKSLAELVKLGFENWDAPEGEMPPAPPADYKAGGAKPEEKPLIGDLTRAEAADVLIKAAHYFITNVYNDMYPDIVGHEWFAGAVQCAYQNGLLPHELTPDGKFRPEEKITLADFAVMAVSAYTSRNPVPEAKACPFDEVTEDWRRDYIRRAYAVGIISDGDDVTSAVPKARAAKTVSEMKL